MADYYQDSQPNSQSRCGSENRLPLSPALLLTADLDNLFKATRLRSRGIAWKDSVLGFRANAVSNTIKLRDELLNGKYKILPYLQFTIFEPKRREIVATSFRDGVVQKSLCKNYLYQALTRHFIYDNGANQIGKGTDFSRNRLKILLHRFERNYGSDGWVVQFDIHNFFGSLDHGILKRMFRKYLDDKFGFAYCDMSVDSYENDVGIGLGSELSQLMALMYLDGLDHLIKEKLRAPVYVRYMDDGVMVFRTKEEARTALRLLRHEVKIRKLELNPNKTKMYSLKQPITFLGWRYILKENGRIILKPKKGKVKKLKKRIGRMIHGGVPMELINESMNASIASLKWGNAQKEIRSIQDFYNKEKINYGKNKKSDYRRKTC